MSTRRGSQLGRSHHGGDTKDFEHALATLDTGTLVFTPVAAITYQTR